VLQSHLFLHHILLCHLEARQIREATAFAAHYQNLVYFAHALEILLHTVVESESTLECESDTDEGELSSEAVLPSVVEFLDHFDAALDVVVGCARKTEMTRWRRLFSIVGNPKALFEVCPHMMFMAHLSIFSLDLSRISPAEDCGLLSASITQSRATRRTQRRCR
jgi:RAB6A-GEF complex partner protein 1